MLGWVAAKMSTKMHVSHTVHLVAGALPMQAVGGSSAGHLSAICMADPDLASSVGWGSYRGNI